MSDRLDDEDEIVFEGIELSKDFKELVKKMIEERREALQEEGRLLLSRLIEIDIISEMPRYASRSREFRKLVNKALWGTVLKDFKTDPTMKDHELLNPEAIEIMMSKYISAKSSQNTVSKNSDERDSKNG